MIENSITTKQFGLLVPKNKWKIIHVDSEEVTDGPVRNLIDGDQSTFWHTQWMNKSPKHPHEVQIDLGATYELSGFIYVPRQGQSNGRIAKYEFFVSNDSSSWGSPQIKGRFSDSSSTQTVSFNKTVKGRFIRLVVLSEISGKPWTSVAELGVCAVRKIE